MKARECVSVRTLLETSARRSGRRAWSVARARRMRAFARVVVVSAGCWVWLCASGVRGLVVEVEVEIAEERDGDREPCYRQDGCVSY